MGPSACQVTTSRPLLYNFQRIANTQPGGFEGKPLAPVADGRASGEGEEEGGRGGGVGGHYFCLSEPLNAQYSERLLLPLMKSCLFFGSRPGKRKFFFGPFTDLDSTL